jgi:SpoIIAA-like
MIQIMPESHGKIIGVKPSGKLTDRDYQEVLIPTLESLIKEHGKIRLLCLLDEGFAGMEVGAMWDDAKFFLPHKDDFEKMAIVGGPQWVKLAMKIFAPLMARGCQSLCRRAAIRSLGMDRRLRLC